CAGRAGDEKFSSIEHGIPWSCAAILRTSPHARHWRFRRAGAAARGFPAECGDAKETPMPAPVMNIADAQYADLAERSRSRGSAMPQERFGGRIAPLAPALRSE